jgi:hypothetical protein
MIKEWGRAGKSVIVSSHILHEIESMTNRVLLVNQGRVLAEGDVHQLRDLIDEHPHTVSIKADHIRSLARELLGHDDVLSLTLEEDAVNRSDRAARRVLREAHRVGRQRRAWRDSRGLLTGRQPAGGVRVSGEGLMASSSGTRPSLVGSTLRVFEFSLGQMLWSRRSVFLAILAGAPVTFAAIVRIVSEIFVAGAGGRRPPTPGEEVFGVMMWLMYVHFIVPVLGVFYGTAFIADEVEDKTITYLFTRPIQRRAVVFGKYLAYLVCSTLLVLPSAMAVFFLIVPIGGSSIGRAFPGIH